MKTIIFTILMLFNLCNLHALSTDHFVLNDGVPKFYKYEIKFTTFTGSHYAFDDADRDRITAKLDGKHKYIVSEISIDKDEMAVSTNVAIKSMQYENYIGLFKDKEIIKKEIFKEAGKIVQYKESQSVSGLDFSKEIEVCQSKISLMKRIYIKLP